MTSVLFVCLGNICRSPAAEGVFKSLLDESGVSGVEVDSAGTSGFHAGELADERMRDHASRRGIDLTSRSRQFLAEDFRKFDYIIVMDNSNYRNVTALDPEGEFAHKVLKMMDYAPELPETEVPDPYYGGAAGFERVLDILEVACSNFLSEIQDGRS